MYGPLAMLMMGGGALGSQKIINDRTYTPAGIYEKPELWGMDARLVLGTLGAIGSMVFPPIAGMVAAGAAVGAATAWQSSGKVKEVYQLAALEFDNRALAQEHQLAIAPPGALAPPVAGLPQAEHWEAGAYGPSFDRSHHNANNPRGYLQGLMGD